MTLRKNSTDKKKFVFHTQLEKGNFEIFEEYPLSEIMQTFRTQDYYTIDAILKYFGTLENKKNGIEILKEKLVYLKDKGFTFSEEFAEESGYIPVNGSYQHYKSSISSIRQVFKSHETYNKEVYTQIFQAIADEMIALPVLPVSFENIVGSDFYRKHTAFIKHFIPQFMNEIDNRHSEITHAAIVAMLSVKKENESATMVYHLPEILDNYLTHNPHDNKIWCSILSKADKLYLFNNLVKKHLLTKDNKDEVISYILKHTPFYQNKNNVLPYFFRSNSYHFKNENLENYYDMDDIYLRKTLIPALIETDIQITDSVGTRKIMANLIEKADADKSVGNNLLTLERINDRQNNIHSLSTRLLEEKSLFSVYLESIKPQIIKDSRGIDIEKYGVKYAYITNDLSEQTKKLVSDFYQKEDNVLIKSGILKNINVFLLPGIISSLLKKDPDTAFELDLFDLFSDYETDITEKNDEKHKKRIHEMMYSVLNEFRKHVEKNKDVENKLLFQNKTLYNRFIKDNYDEKSGVRFEEMRMKVQVSLFMLNINNPVLNNEEKKDFAEIIIKNSHKISETDLYKTEKFTSTLSFIEKYLLNAEFKNTENISAKNMNIRI